MWGMERFFFLHFFPLINITVIFPAEAGNDDI